MKLAVYDVDDIVVTAAGRIARVVRVSDSHVTIRYEGLDPNDMATFTAEAAGVVLKFGDK